VTITVSVIRKESRPDQDDHGTCVYTDVTITVSVIRKESRPDRDDHGTCVYTDVTITVSVIRKESRPDQDDHGTYVYTDVTITVSVIRKESRPDQDDHGTCVYTDVTLHPRLSLSCLTNYSTEHCEQDASTTFNVVTHSCRCSRVQRPTRHIIGKMLSEVRDRPKVVFPLTAVTESEQSVSAVTKTTPKLIAYLRP